MQHENQVMAEELSQSKKNFENLEAESKMLFEEMRREKKDEVIEELSNTNQELKAYIDSLEKSERIAYKGKMVSRKRAEL